jgi:hypothetical protein
LSEGQQLRKVALVQIDHKTLQPLQIGLVETRLFRVLWPCAYFYDTLSPCPIRHDHWSDVVGNNASLTRHFAETQVFAIFLDGTLTGLFVIRWHILIELAEILLK